MIIASFLILIGISCEKSADTGIALSFKGETSALKSTSNSGSFTFSEAMIGVHEIEIEMETEEEDGESEMETEIEYEFEGPYAVDLLSGVSDPEIGLAELIPGNYNELEAEISPILDGGTKSVIIKGSYTDTNQETVDFEFSTASEIELEVESDAGFYLDEGTILELVVTFDLAMLFDGVDFASAEKNDMGVVIMDDSHNVELTNKVKSNISQYAEIEDDDEQEKDDD